MSNTLEIGRQLESWSLSRVGFLRSGEMTDAAARLLSGTKIDHGLFQVVHVDLHWIDVDISIDF